MSGTDFRAVKGGGPYSALCSRGGELLQVLSREGEIRVLRFGSEGSRP